MPHTNGNGGLVEATLPKGPTREQAELMQMYDLVEARLRKLPTGLPWREIRVRKTQTGLAVAVTV